MLEVAILKAWIIGILISSIFQFYKEKKSVTLYCGLFAFCGDPNIITHTMSRMIAAKVKILGLYNMERGRHSCGIYAGGSIIKGVDKEKEFSDFIAVQNIPDTLETGNHVIIGHTRWATHGVHSKANAHPFMIDDNFVLAHNGTIRNAWDLCNKYKIAHNNITVDSLALANLIYNEGFDILNEYQGFASLLMSYIDEPNTLYIYRGESCRTHDGVMEEERPLFYLKCEEGIYVSSLDKPLFAISDSAKDKIERVDGSTVIKIKNGQITKERVAINRTKVNIGISTTANTYYPTSGPSTTSTNINPTLGVGLTNTTVATTTGISCCSNSQDSAATAKFVPLTWHETLPPRIHRYKGRSGLFYHMGRYWVVDKDETIYIAHGCYYINSKGFTFPSKTSKCHNYFFYEGVMMRSKQAYMEALEEVAVLKNDQYNFAHNVSKYSTYPVCNLRKDIFTRCKNTTDFSKYGWYIGQDKLNNFGFTPRFSDRNYHIENGGLTRITSQLKQGEEKTIEMSTYLAESGTAPAKVIELDKETKVSIAIGQDKSKYSQTIIPFNKDTIAERKIQFGHFYWRFTSIEKIKDILSTTEMNAIRYYICDIMLQEMNVETESIFDDQVDMQVNMFLSHCIETGESIIDNWNEKEYDSILHYLYIADKYPTGDYYTSEDEEKTPTENTKGEDEQAKAIYEHTTWSKITDDTPFPETDGIIINESAKDLDQEPPMIDVIVESENQTFHESEKEDTNNDRDYAFEDSVDGLLKVRNCADELQAIESDDFAQNSAQALYNSVDSLLIRLRELAEKHNETKIYTELVRNLKIRANL